MLEHVRVLVEEADGVVEQVVEVHGPGGEEAGGVDLVYLGDLPQPRVRGGAVLGGKALGGEQLVPRGVQPGEDGLGRIYLVVQVHLADDALHYGEAVRRVVDGEVARVAELVGVAAEYAHAGGVEGAGPDVVGPLAEHGLETGLELVGGLVGEGDGDDAPGLHGLVRGEAARLVRGPGLQHCKVRLRCALRHLVRIRGAAIFEQICDPVYQHRGLAASSPCKNQQRAFRGEHGLPLHGVELCEIGLDDPLSRRDISFFKVFIHSSDILPHQILPHNPASGRKTPKSRLFLRRAPVCVPQIRQVYKILGIFPQEAEICATRRERGEEGKINRAMRTLTI